MLCKYCGKEINDDSKFCQYCGELIKETADKNNDNDFVKKQIWVVVIFIVAFIILLFTNSYNTNSNYTHYTEQSNDINEASVKNDNSVSLEYINALEKARIYSNFSYMSKKNIYEQLVSAYGEGFTKEAAQYAIDNLNADYKNNALQKARIYSNYAHMSKNSIYEQLTSEYGEGFTQEEAKYAINNL
ncbi:Ltp family lipoprotein [bacterium]|nr:Ltp family lipoprotein [bacterium]